MPRFARASSLLVLFPAAALWAGAADGVAPDAVSYSDEIGPIVANYCATCHHGEDPDGGFVLDSYEDVLAMTEKGDLLERINDELDPMPPIGRMPERQRAFFEAWVEGGYVETGDGEGDPLFVPFTPPEITPADIAEGGFELLERLQGHWIGSMNLMGEDLDWFGWDFRAIGPSHVHGIFEGGTLGNLFTSFFVADLEGTRTVMARNGGVLNGIYRTSYFVLDRITKEGESIEYRLVDAYGGEGIMWMSLTFTGDRLEFLAYTSRMGVAGEPRQHQRFVGERRHVELAEAAAKAVGFPKRVAEREYPKGFPVPDWGPGVPVTSSSYMWEDPTLSIERLGRMCGDPIRIDQMPHVAKLEVSIERSEEIAGVPLEVYLSRDPLTDESGKLLMQWGYLREDAYETVLMFPELSAGEERFTFTYLHPGTYYLTVVADVNRDGLASAGDVTHRSVEVVVAPGETTKARVTGLDVRN